MLTIFVCYATIIFVGCENGNIKINEYTPVKQEILESSGEEEKVLSRK